MPSFYASKGIVAVALVSGLFNVACPYVHAVPVTLRFDAEVASIIVRNGGSQRIPEVSIGDSASIEFSFDAPSVEFNNQQQHSIVLRVAGRKYTTSGFSITVRDQIDRLIPLAGSIADPANTPDVDRPFGEPSDSLWIGAISGSSGDFDTVLSGANSEVEWDSPMLFAGNEFSLSDVGIPEDPTAWQAMEFKESAFEFSDIGTSNSTRVGLYIHTVSRVPEPGPILLTTLASLLFTNCRYRE
jgi:hypothetical protein